MAESELSKRITKAVRAGDRLILNIQKNTQELLAALRELKELREKGKEKDD